MHVQRRSFIVVGLGIAAALVATVYVAGSSADGADGASTAPAAALVGTSTTGDLRVAVTAQKADGGGDMPTAVVKVTTSQRVDGQWRRTGTHRVRGTYFWHTVTGRRAVCRLEIRTAGTGASFRPHVVVQLLLTPSLGCGSAYRYALTG